MPQIQEQIVAAVVLAVDVPAIKQLEYQQSKFENPEVTECPTFEQIVDSPVPRGRVPGPKVFLPGQSYSLTADQIVDNPVPRPGGGGDLQGLHRGQSSTAFSEQIAEFPDPGGGRQDFEPVQGPAASSTTLAGHADQRVFSHFSPPEKVRRSRAPRGQNWVRSRAHGRHELSWGRVLSATTLTTARISMEHNMGCGVVLVGMLLLVYLLTQWLGTAAGAGCAWVPRSVSPRKLLGEFPHLRRVAARAVRTWKAGLLYFCSRNFQPLFWCMGVACGVQRIGFSGRVRYVAANSNPEAFGLRSHRMESMHSRCFWL